MIRSMTDHALSCDVCYSWVTSGDFGNNPKCQTGTEIRQEIIKDNEMVWESTIS